MARRAAADWRDAAAYAPLARCDRALLAWEWLRRDDAYRRSAAAGEAGGCSAFGLVRFEDPTRSAGDARPFWRAGLDPGLLRASAEPRRGAGAFELASVAGFATLAVEGGIEHLLLSDGWHALRIDIVAGSVTAGAVRLRWHLAGVAGLAPQVEALRRLIALIHGGRFGALAAPTKAQARARRVAVLLRVHDALADGASHLDVAEAMFGIDRARWRIDAASYRARAQRLIAASRRMALAGPAAILRDGTRLAPSLR